MLAPPLSSSPWKLSFITTPNISLSSSSLRRRILSSSSCRCSSSSSSTPLKAEVVKPNSTQHSPPPLEEARNPNSGDGATTKVISEIQVPRQKYIHVSKSDLLEAIVSMSGSQLHLAARDDDEDVDSSISQFLLISSCLDSILHAEHKSVLEEMRTDYFSTLSERDEDVATPGVEVDKGVDLADTSEDKGVGNKNNAANDTMKLKDNQLAFLNGLDFFHLWGSPSDDFLSNARQHKLTVQCFWSYCSNPLPTFFHVQDAEFEELSVRDLMLTSALNTDYLLTLPIYVDWKKASESNTIVFRRGYSTEKQKGLLIVEKLDYLQSKILQTIFGLLTKPLMNTGLWIKEVIQNFMETEGIQVWLRRPPIWVQELFLSRKLYFSETQLLNAVSKPEELDSNLPIWLAAQKAVSRYEGFLSPTGPRSRLIKKFLTMLGLAPSTPEVPFQFDSEDNVASEPHLRPVSLSRISLSDVWRPATRQYCGNNVWRMFKVGFSLIFSQSVLQEPAFQELILLYTEENRNVEDARKADIPSLRLKIYEKIPMPDLAVRLDAATIIGLLAYTINYKFEDALSSPSAVLLDFIAAGALILYLTRVALGYKQTRDRYELLVNRALDEKTLASGFGTVHFLLDASEQQQYKECILAFGILLKTKNGQPICRETLGEECERFLYRNFKEMVNMPVDKAVDRLIKFGLVVETTNSGKNVLQVVPCSSAYDALRKRWGTLLRYKHLIWGECGSTYCDQSPSGPPRFT